jgi:hypothetical protein
MPSCERHLSLSRKSRFVLPPKGLTGSPAYLPLTPYELTASRTDQIGFDVAVFDASVFVDALVGVGDLCQTTGEAVSRRRTPFLT